MQENPLGKSTAYPERYDPGLLYPISRWPSRSLLDIDKNIPLHGFDFWRLYEVSWLNPKGRPMVAVGELYFDAKAENIVESKSLKLYFNSLNQERFPNAAALIDVVISDLSRVTRGEVVMVLRSLDDEAVTTVQHFDAVDLDGLDVEITEAVPTSDLLRLGAEHVTRIRLRSDLFRANCPTTGQPDWASVLIEYSGRRIDAKGLLAYLCSYRTHQGYHEECAEHIYRDLMVRCQPRHLVVGLQFTRRGGIEINPYRSNEPISPDDWVCRLPRQ